jgi:hypothetical protein
MTDSQASAAQLPDEILRDVPWRFWDAEPYADRGEFEAAVSALLVDLERPAEWRAGEIALRVPRVRILFFGVDSPDDDDYQDFSVEVTSDDGVAFTRGELLHKVHNAVVLHLNAVDHCYFEGLKLENPAFPTYQMEQGS